MVHFAITAAMANLELCYKDCFAMAEQLSILYSLLLCVRILFSIQPSGSCYKYFKAKQKNVVNTQPNCWYAAKWYFKVFWCSVNERRTMRPSSRSVKSLKIKLTATHNVKYYGWVLGFFSQHSFLKVLTSKLPYPGKKSSGVISRRCL